MSEPDSSLDIDALVQEYATEKDWEQDKAHVRNTSEAVQTLVQAIVDTGSIDEYAMRTVYNLCQNDNALSPDMKRERIDALEIDPVAKTEIKNHIEEGTGVVGKGTYSVPVEGYEEETYEFLATVINSEDRETIDEAINEFAALDIDRVQAGIISSRILPSFEARSLVSRLQRDSVVVSVSSSFSAVILLVGLVR